MPRTGAPVSGAPEKVAVAFHNDDATHLLCFGGSFNPIHVGHERCALAVIEKIDARRVTLIPTGDPPHKRTVADLAPAVHRLAMVRLVARRSDKIRVSDFELTSPGPHYTLNTARALTLRACKRVAWLIGADQLLKLPTWHEWKTLVREVEFFVMRRPGYAIDWAALPDAVRALEKNVVDIPEIDVSATEIRRRVRAGQSIDGLVAPEVADYIAAHRLYRTL